MQQEYRQVLRYGFGMLALVAGFLLVFFLSWTYEELLPVFDEFNADKPWVSEGLVEVNRVFGLSETVYMAVKISLAVLFTGSLFMLSRLQSGAAGRFLSGFIPAKTLSFFGQKLRSQWQKLSRFEKALLLFAWLALSGARLYLLNLYEYEIDEASAYFLFLYRGLPGVITYYIIPNNHVFYSLLCLPLLSVFQDPYWAYKLPTLIISTLSFPVIYLAVRSVFNFPVTFIAVTGLSFSYHLLYYAVHGRGYSILILCTVLVYIAVLKLFEGRENFYWLVFLVCTVVGFYTVPVFLYPFAGIVVFAFFAFLYAKNYQALRQLIVCTFFAGLATVLLYLPIILVSGPELLFNNGYVVRKPYSFIFDRMSFFFPFTQGSVLGIESKGMYLWLAAVFCLVLLLVFRRKAAGYWQCTGLKPVYLIWILCGALVPWVLIFIQGVLPPERTWTYKAFVDFLAVAIMLQLLCFTVLRNQVKFSLILMAALMLFYGSYETLKHRRNKQIEHFSNDPFFKIITHITKQPNAVIFTSDGFYMYYIKYDFLVKNKYPADLDLFYIRPNKNYNVLILSRTNPVKTNLDLNRYHLMHQDNFVQVYFLKRPE